jgi:RNA polymerase sigma-70 factor (ECF subfamily)
MASSSQFDALLIRRIREGDDEAWQQLIDRFEGRLLAYVDSRLRNRSASEDIVQETFIGFLTSLPNFDPDRTLEGYLFSIAAHKLTDHLRREGRRPTVPLSAGDDSQGTWELPGSARRASSIHRSVERRGLEDEALAEAIAEQIAHWRQRQDWSKIQCAELLFLRGLGNKQAAKVLGLSEQQVANYKFDFLAKLKAAIHKQGLSFEVFPELNSTRS